MRKGSPLSDVIAVGAHARLRHSNNGSGAFLVVPCEFYENSPLSGAWGLLSCHVPIGRAVQSAVRQSVITHGRLTFIHGTHSTLKICAAMRCAFVL